MVLVATNITGQNRKCNTCSWQEIQLPVRKRYQVNELLHSLTKAYTPIRELTDPLILFGLQGFDRQLFLPTLFLNN